MAIMVSDEMRRRQSVDPVTRQLLQVKNTMVYSWNTAFYSAVVANASIQTLAVANTWASAGATIRADLAQACYLVENANIVSPAGVTQWLGFEADTLIINHGTKNTFLQSNTFFAPYGRHRARTCSTRGLPQEDHEPDVMSPGSSRATRSSCSGAASTLMNSFIVYFVPTSRARRSG
jgi:hypothetical protein